MELHQLRPAAGSTHSSKRLGRGEGSGKGGTSTKGHKGDKARTGHKNKRNHEGGQMPLQMRLPKRGFKNIHRIEYVALNLGRLQDIADKTNATTITVETLYEQGVISKTDRIKILAGGELKSGLNVSGHKCSEAAKAALEAKGGSITIV
jgi:large subunit ribosomal protein L15